MEVVTATPTGSGVNPFHDHDVREWSRIDSLTGALERARLETDHWSATTMNSSHNYGKVVDSLSRTDPDGALRHAARRQLEVFNSQVPGARLQVVKTHSVAKWTNKTSSVPTSIEDTGGFGDKDFENLQLSINPLDLTSQKSKASILRSVSRRPPTRQRPKEPPPTLADQSEFLRQAHISAATNLHRVSRLCHQIHETAVKQAFGRISPRPTISDRQNGESSVEIVEIESIPNGHTNLTRTRSSSNEDINQQKQEKDPKSAEDLEDLEQLQNWRRTSKIRRSLQFPKTNKQPVNLNKPIDLPESSVSVRKIREELEKGRRLNTALRNNSVDLDALDQILQSISSTSSDKASDDIESETPKKHKRNSFVTVESIQEVKGRLRRTSSPSSDIYKANAKEEDADDGIVTEDNPTTNKEASIVDKTHVRSYVYGMETMLNKKPGLGTGSLESRIKLVNGTNSARNEDWYNRRKSYGFEQVHSHDNNSSSISHKNKNVVESSTDSGICRSTEIVVVPTVSTKNGYRDKEDYSSENSDSETKLNGTNSSLNGIQLGQVKKLANTFNQQEKPSAALKNLRETWSRPTKDETWVSPKTELKSTTITIPIAKNNNIVDLTWNDEPEREVKRHSIAVDESKYVNMTNSDTKYRRTSLALNDQFPKHDDDDSNFNRRTKKVEFCKTEVHFAAESGKVNIVATDEKPPPTQNFRRRRRNSGPTLEEFNKNGLPVLHFGDSSYEKNLFGMVEGSEGFSESSQIGAFGVVTVNTNININNEVSEEEKKELMDNEIKGILKNKMIKPKPYHLGEPVPLTDSNNVEEDNKWGVRLRHIEKPPDPPIWKSTVTVQNYYEKQQSEEQPEFQKLLKNLRPTRKTDYNSDSDNRLYGEDTENRRSSWAMSDRKLEDNQKNETTKGYSTKINFGDGQATVVQDERVPTWPKGENLTKDAKQLLNKGLVVRIGREDSALNHTVCSKMTTTQDTSSATTTTKITIDLSPSPPTKDENRFTYAKYQRSHNHSFKSTSLILNTIKDRSKNDDKTASVNNKNEIPKQLEALKKLYDDISDSDADKEVQLLMSKILPDSSAEDDTASVLSGSWSKMRAHRNISEHFSRMNAKGVRNDLRLDSKIEKEEPFRNLSADSDLPPGSPSYPRNSTRLHLSPVSPRKYHPTGNTELKSSTKLSSPSLVGKNNHSEIVAIPSSAASPNKSIKSSRDSPNRSYRTGRDSPSKTYKNGTDSPSKTYKSGRDSPSKTYKPERESPSRNYKTAIDKNLQTKHSNDNIVLRQPKKSEMTYFGVNVSPKPLCKKSSPAVIRKQDKLSADKPDLIQHYRKPSSPKVRQKSKPLNEVESPLYENLKNKYSRDFDSSILDELTKAADQILQAVNDYEKEETFSRNLTDDDSESKNKPLETISEVKSWKPDIRVPKAAPQHTKARLRHTSSTSSVDSVSSLRMTQQKTTKPAPERQRKKVEKAETSNRVNVKARRLQRASSREALLQSHGSSSEDLPAKVEVPIRKPRMVKKTKAMQFSMTNGPEMKKSPSSSRTSVRKEETSKEERVLGSLPEIRHKTAVSTIRSTTDRSVRERTRLRTDETRKKPVQKKDVVRGTSSSIGSRAERERSTKTPSSVSQNKEIVTQHRISTANIKKCSRSEGALRH